MGVLVLRGEVDDGVLLGALLLRREEARRVQALRVGLGCRRGLPLRRRRRAAEQRVDEGERIHEGSTFSWASGLCAQSTSESSASGVRLASRDGFLAVLEHADEARDLVRDCLIAVMLASGGAGFGALDTRGGGRREP